MERKSYHYPSLNIVIFKMFALTANKKNSIIIKYLYEYMMNTYQANLFK